MDPITLAAAAVSLVTPYLLSLGNEAAESAAKESGKSVWDWIKGNFVSPAGAEAVSDAERDPKDPTNAQALQLALTKALKADSDAATALAELLKKSGASLSSQSCECGGRQQHSRAGERRKLGEHIRLTARAINQSLVDQAITV